MKIYDRTGAPNTARVRIILAAKGLEDKIDFVTIDLIGAQQKGVLILPRFRSAKSRCLNSMTAQ